MANLNIEARHLPKLTVKLAAANRKASKLGLHPFSFVELRRFDVKRHDEYGIPYFVDMAEIETVGEPPVLSGWQVCARIEDTYTGKIISGPHAEVGEQFRSESQCCDHCGTNRARKDTFVLRHVETGEVKRVGRSCLADHLHTSPEAMLFWWSVDNLYRSANEDESESYGWQNWYGYCLETLLALAAQSIEVNGYRKTDADLSTATCAREAYRDHTVKPEPRHLERARAAISWAKEQTEPGYLANIATIARSESVESRNIGFAVSILQAYSRAMGEERKSSTGAAVGQSQHVGEVGKRSEFVVTIETVHVFDGAYGRTYISIFKDDAGNRLVWKGSNAVCHPGSCRVDDGSRVKIKGTVKAHSEFRGMKQTELSRVALVRVLVDSETQAA